MYITEEGIKHKFLKESFKDNDDVTKNCLPLKKNVRRVKWFFPYKIHRRRKQFTSYLEDQLISVIVPYSFQLNC